MARTTIRVGAGILFDSLGTFLTYRVTGQNAPWGVTVSETSGPYQFTIHGVMSPGAILSRCRSSRPAVMSSLFPLPIPSSRRWPCHPPRETWNLGVQHQFARNWIATITYLGNETSHLMVGNEINPAVYIPGNCGSSCMLHHRQHAGETIPEPDQPERTAKYFSTMDFG